AQVAGAIDTGKTSRGVAVHQLVRPQDQPVDLPLLDPTHLVRRQDPLVLEPPQNVVGRTILAAELAKADVDLMLWNKLQTHQHPAQLVSLRRGHAVVADPSTSGAGAEHDSQGRLNPR